MENNEIVKAENKLATASFTDFKTMDDMIAFGGLIAKSKLSPLKKGEDVVAAMLMGRELGLGVMVSINNIYPIEGKASSGIHIIAGQLLKAGIAYEVINDYEPVFPIAIVVKDDDGKDKKMIVRNAPYSEPLKEGEIRGNKVIDVQTKIRFTRVLKQPNGEFIKMVVDGVFCKSEIVDAWMLKSNWKNHMKDMMYTRAFIRGAKRVGDDVILGLSETSELADVYNLDYTVKEGVVTILEPTESNKSTTNKEEASSTLGEEVVVLTETKEESSPTGNN